MSRLNGQVYDLTKSADLSETQVVCGSGLVGSVYSRTYERHDQTRPATKSGRARLVEFVRIHGMSNRKGGHSKHRKKQILLRRLNADEDCFVRVNDLTYREK